MREANSKSKNNPHNANNWITKLHDNTITDGQVRQGHKSAHSQYLTPKQKETLIKFFHGKTLFRINQVRAGFIDEDEGHCVNCYVEEYGQEIDEYLRHAVYLCPTIIYIRRQILHEFELELENIPLNIGCVILGTNMIGENRTLNIIVNTIWSLALSMILEQNQLKKVPRADIIIGQIKDALNTIVKVKPASELSICLKTRNLIRVLNSGFSPHLLDQD